MFLLALRLGMTVKELGCRMSSAELAEWMAFDSIQPLDTERRMELSAGVIASTIGNCNLRHGAKAMRPADFMADWDGTLNKEPTAEQMLTLAKALSQSGLGTITTGG